MSYISPGLVSSGQTAKATSNNEAVALIAALALPAAYRLQHLAITNEGAGAGFFSIDGGTTWARLPAGPAAAVVLDDLCLTRRAGAILVKRVEDGANVTGVYAYAW